MRRFIQHVENDGFIDPTQRKKVGFEPNLAQMLYITSSMKRNYCGAYCCLYTSYSNIKNLKSTPIPLLGIKHEKTHKKIRICRSKFRFFCLDGKSCISWVEKVSPKPFATISFVIYAWFPKRYLIWGDSSWSNSAKKGGFWALLSRNALHYIFNEENL
jgi:hypothetical protein